MSSAILLQSVISSCVTKFVSRTLLPHSFISSSISKLRDTCSTASKLYQLICNKASCHVQNTALQRPLYDRFVSSVLLHIIRSSVRCTIASCHVQCWLAALSAILYLIFVSCVLLLSRSSISSSQRFLSNVILPYKLFCTTGSCRVQYCLAALSVLHGGPWSTQCVLMRSSGK